MTDQVGASSAHSSVCGDALTLTYHHREAGFWSFLRHYSDFDDKSSLGELVGVWLLLFGAFVVTENGNSSAVFSAAVSSIMQRELGFRVLFLAPCC